MSLSCNAAVGSACTPTMMGPWGTVKPPFFGARAATAREKTLTRVALLPKAYRSGAHKCEITLCRIPLPGNVTSYSCAAAHCTTAALLTRVALLPKA